MSDREKIEEGEMAIRLASDITGGLGNHPKGTVLRHLSISAFTTLRGAGHEVLEAGATTTVGVDADQAVVTDPKKK